MYTFIAVSLSSLGANFSLSLTDLNSGWGSSYDAATQTITFNEEWTGRGWWLGNRDFTGYAEVVVEFDAVEFQIKMVVEYSEEGSTPSETYVDAGATSIALALNKDLKNDVKQIFIQSLSAGTLKLNAAYVTEEFELGEGVAIPFDEWGGVRLADLQKYENDDIVKLVLNVKTDGDVQVGWGIGKIVPINNYDVQKYALSCLAISDEGELNEYTFTIGQLIEAAKVDGEFYKDEQGQQGITINVWGKTERISLTVYPGEEGPEVVDFTFDSLAEGAYSHTVGNGAAVTVVPDPKKEGKALEVALTNYDSMPTVEVVLPEGATFSDITSVSFDVYATASDWKERMINVNGTMVYKPGAYPQSLWAGEWRTITVEATDFNSAVSEIASLNAFTLGVGLNGDALTYYLDNIVIELGNYNGIKEVAASVPNPITTFPGGIEVDNNGASVGVYGIDGRKIVQTTQSRIYLERGIYIVRVGTDKKASKAIVR